MELDQSIAISVEGLSVDYRISQKSGMLSIMKYNTVKALRNISFEISRGEVVGIIGKNGAGKTTLLRAISGNLRPSQGRIITRGRVYTLSGANPGLIQDMSGRENVRLMSEVYGIPEEERERFEKSVEEFCDLGEAYDRDIRTLSTGMAGRIGFGFTTSLRPEILLMDETLGVGDKSFRKKAEKKSIQFMERGETIMLSTHSLNLAKDLCTRGIFLVDGRLEMDGPIEEVVDEYLASE